MVSIKTVRRIGVAAMIVPGFDHVVSPTLTMILAPSIMQTMFGQGYISATIFFIVLGIFQIVWIGVLLKSNNALFLILGILGNLVSIFIYLISASGVTIFGVPPQPLIAFGVLVKTLECVFVISTVYVLKAGKA